MVDANLARRSVQHSRAACRSIIWEIWALSVDDREVDSVVVDEGETDELASEVRIGLSAGGRWIRTIGTPPNFFGRPSIPAQFTFRNINRLPRARDRWFESISLQRGVRCEPDFLAFGSSDPSSF